MSELQLAELSEAIARSFMGWKPKPVGQRRFRRFEKKVVQRILAGEHPVKDPLGSPQSPQVEL